MRTDSTFMKLALRYAKKGYPRVAPNPLVGCVIVKDGKPAGLGFHEYFGGPHAEVNALRRAGERSRGATMYVTLEPCDHWGKTPPCTEAIIKAGIRRVVAAMTDPNPRIAGRGFKKLKRNGIEVVCGVREKEARELNKDYVISLKAQRSFVIVKAAMSLDGKIAARTGDSRWISGPQARDLVHRLRSRVDGILVGINTVIQDDPELTSHGKGKNPVRIIIDPRLRIPLKSRVLNSQAPTIIIYSALPSKKKLKALENKGVRAMRVLKINKSINFKHIIKELAKISIYKVLIEGGGETIAEALNAAVVDEVLWFVSPKIIGGRLAKTPVEGLGIAKIAHAMPVKDLSVKKLGNDVVISGKLK